MRGAIMLCLNFSCYFFCFKTKEVNNKTVKTKTMREEVTSTKGDKSGTIDELIQYLNDAKLKGATHYSMRWSNDPIWNFKWFETYRIKSEKEIKEDTIKKLQQDISQLSNNDCCQPE